MIQVRYAPFQDIHKLHFYSGCICCIFNHALCLLFVIRVSMYFPPKSSAVFQIDWKYLYLAAKLLKNDLSPINNYKGEDIKQLNIENPDWNFLNRLKRQPDKSSFYYWYHTVQLLTQEKEWQKDESILHTFAFHQ